MIALLLAAALGAAAAASEPPACGDFAEYDLTDVSYELRGVDEELEDAVFPMKFEAWFRLNGPPPFELYDEDRLSKARGALDDLGAKADRGALTPADKAIHVKDLYSGVFATDEELAGKKAVVAGIYSPRGQASHQVVVIAHVDARALRARLEAKLAAQPAMSLTVGELLAKPQTGANYPTFMQALGDLDETIMSDAWLTEEEKSKLAETLRGELRLCREDDES